METQELLRRFKSKNSKRLLKTRASSSQAPAIFDNGGSAEQNFSGVNKAKRVRFGLPESVQHPIPDAPKTSEYAFFKKLKGEMGGICRPLHEDRGQIEATYSNDPNTENSIPSNKFKLTDRKMRSPLQAEKQMPTYQFSFPSPPIRAESDSARGLNSTDEFRRFESRVPLPFSNVTPDAKNLVLSPFPSGPKVSGDEYVGKGIFTARRKKLRQLAANSYPEVGEGCSKGFDLVSALLKRLLSANHKNECCHFASSEESVVDTTYQFASPRELYNEEKIGTPRNSSRFHSEYCYNDDSPEDWFGGPRKRVISMWDVPNSNTPLTEYNAMTDFQIEEMNSFCSLDREAIQKKYLETDSVSFPFFDCDRSTSSGHLQQDIFHDPYEFASGKPRHLLLCWDTNEDREHHSGCALATSSNIPYRQTLYDSLKLDASLNAVTMHSSSSHSEHSLDLHSLPYFLLDRGCNHDLGVDNEDNYSALEANHFLSSTPSCLSLTMADDDEDNYAAPEVNHFLSSTPRYLTMAEDFDNCYLKNKVILRCKDDPFYIDSGSGRKGHMEALSFSRGFTDDLGWKLLPSSDFPREDYSSNSHNLQLPSDSEAVNSFALMQDEESSFYYTKSRETTIAFPRDAFDILNSFSSNLHVSLNKSLGQSWLLDYSGRAGSRSTTYLDAEENQWNSS